MVAHSSDGIASMIDYSGAATPEAAIDLLLDAIPNVDTTSTSGAQQGSTYLGFLDEMSPMAAIQLRVELEAIQDSAAFGGTSNTASGQHTVTAGEATANLVNIVTGLPDITLANCAVSVFRAGTNVTADAVITEPSAGTIRVADGGVTYNTTAGDIINWFAK